MHPLLQNIRQRPRMYFGPYPLFASLVTYVYAYATACQEARRLDAASALVPLLPEGDRFYVFVAERLGEYAHELGWSGLITKHTDGDQAAFDLFFELLSAYDQQPTSAA